MLSCEPQPLWEIFSDICAIPHGTGNTKQIRQYLINWGKQHNFEVKYDDYNVLLSKNPHTGFEKAPIICIQTHMDMVCASEPDVEYNPVRDPIIPILSRIDNKQIVQAQGTSLGADDGIGIAMSFYLLLEKDLQFGKIEILITDYEEAADMLGSKNLKETWLNAKYLINIDRTRDGSDNFIQISSGGGFDGIISFNDIYYFPNDDRIEDLINKQSACDENQVQSIDQENQSQQKSDENQIKKLDEILQQLEAKRNNKIKYSIFTLIIRGLAPGGSINIDDIMAPDALRVLLDLIDGNLKGTEQILLLKVGETPSLKPQSAILQLAVEKKEEAEILKDKISDMFEQLQKPNKYTKSIEKVEMHTFIEHDVLAQVLIDTVKSRKIINMLHSMPKGIIQEAGNKPQCSINIGQINIGPDVAIPSISFRARAIDRKMLQQIQDIFSDIVKVLKVGSFRIENEYFPWALDKELNFYQVSQQAFRDVFNTNPNILECYSGHEIGNIVYHYENIRAIGIGPAIQNAHTSKEYVEVQSIQKTYDALKHLIHLIYESEGIQI